MVGSATNARALSCWMTTAVRGKTKQSSLDRSRIAERRMVGGAAERADRHALGGEDDAVDGSRHRSRFYAAIRRAARSSGRRGLRGARADTPPAAPRRAAPPSRRAKVSGSFGSMPVTRPTSRRVVATAAASPRAAPASARRMPWAITRPDDSRGARAQGHSYAELVGALRHAVGDESVQPDCGKHHRERGKGAEQKRVDAGLDNRSRDDFVEPVDALYRHVRAHCAECRLHRFRKRGRFAVRSDGEDQPGPWQQGLHRVQKQLGAWWRRRARRAEHRRRRRRRSGQRIAYR